MGISKSVFSEYVRNFQFRELFNEMGWNNDRFRHPVVVNDKTYLLTGIAQKSGFRILSCVPDSNNTIPDKETRKKIQRQVTKLFQEHIIIYYDASKTKQIWQTPIRRPNFPIKTSEITVIAGKDPELLYQRASGLFFTLDEEETITIVDVTKRVTENFQQNNEVVTKKFYEAFKKEHTSFLKFIKGISDNAKRDWYASLMLNRLMFCYFIQKQRFLDNNMDYLQQKLIECKAKKGRNKFYSFYRDFLLSLFHKGLGAPVHSKELEVELGKIPYLNGGLFDVHVIEKEFSDIQIEDKAFERLFDFFDQWNWHLDTRVEASGKDINPDVIGYIFEKYINDRAQMGAYYTKEDITDYISKNCILPWLFDEVKRNYPGFFAKDGWLWQYVKNSGDEYIYDAVKYGIPQEGGLFDDLPSEVKDGFDPELENKVVDGNGPWLWEMRKSWNKSAPSDIALPTEIYREVIERRKKYAEVKDKIVNGEIFEINDFITLNLNIRQFAQDVIEITEDPEFIRHFYKALSGVTILDPTCGSGAFLFAALNILEPLYESSIKRMQEFVQNSPKGKFKFFEQILNKVNAPEHPNLQYFIYKSIILNNLFGVDIMNEAVEIAKLRLFLKLVATVDADYSKENLGLEPLPDVDFNIRAGNTLVGYATKKQIDEIAGMFVTEEHRKKILEQCDVVARVFERYKEIQLNGGEDYNEFKKAKDDLNIRLKNLTDDLDKVCYVDMYNGDEKIIQKDLAKVDKKIVDAFNKWRESHKPFHWFAEYYEILNGDGGFDVVIGNPPYVEYSKVNKDYSLKKLQSLECGNLFAFVIEKGLIVIRNTSYFGFIVPVSFNSTHRMSIIREIFFQNRIYVSSFADRPSCLFNGVHQILTIFFGRKESTSTVLNGGFKHWNVVERKFIFEKLTYKDLKEDLKSFKINSDISNCIVKKIIMNKNVISSYFIGTKGLLTYSGGTGGYWLRAFCEEQASNEYKIVFVDDTIVKHSLLGIFNSNLFYYFWRLVSDCRHLTKNDINKFKIDLPTDNPSKLVEVSKKQNNALIQTNEIREGKITYDQYRPSKTKLFIDQIDSLLAIHYGFTHAELDFIINYDIKYRMGKELEEGGEETPDNSRSEKELSTCR
jgi:hypothetical protein